MVQRLSAALMYTHKRVALSLTATAHHPSASLHTSISFHSQHHAAAAAAAAVAATAAFRRSSD